MKKFRTLRILKLKKTDGIQSLYFPKKVCSRGAALLQTSKMESLAAINKSKKLLSIVLKLSILDACGVPG